MTITEYTSIRLKAGHLLSESCFLFLFF
jgi:hypothetical protein